MPVKPFPMTPTVEKNPPRCAPGGGGAESIRADIRRIQTHADQICNDAADIEDARFLAEDIALVCRRLLGNEIDAAMLPSTPRDVVRESRHAVRSVARERLACLSAREMEIFTYLAEGSSAAEIGTRLSRSAKTINNHRTRILQKLGLRNATELVRLALESGVVSI